MGYIESRESREEKELENWKNERKERLKEIREVIGSHLQETYFSPLDFQSKKAVIVPKKYPAYTPYTLSTPIIDAEHFIFDEKPDEHYAYTMAEEGIQKSKLRGIVIKIHTFPKEFLSKNKIKEPRTNAELIAQHEVYDYQKTIEKVFQQPIKFAWIDKSFTCFFDSAEMSYIDLPIIGQRMEGDLCCYFVLISENLLQLKNPSLYKELTKFNLNIKSKCSPFGSMKYSDASGLCFYEIFKGTDEELEMFCLRRDLPFINPILKQLENENQSNVYNWQFVIKPFIRAIALGDVRLGRTLWGKQVPIINYYLADLSIISICA
jgi:hypothetical protein